MTLKPGPGIIVEDFTDLEQATVTEFVQSPDLHLPNIPIGANLGEVKDFIKSQGILIVKVETVGDGTLRIFLEPDPNQEVGSPTIGLGEKFTDKYRKRFVAVLRKAEKVDSIPLEIFREMIKNEEVVNWNNFHKPEDVLEVWAFGPGEGQADLNEETYHYIAQRSKLYKSEVADQGSLNIDVIPMGEIKNPKKGRPGISMSLKQDTPPEFIEQGAYNCFNEGRTEIEEYLKEGIYIVILAHRWKKQSS